MVISLVQWGLSYKEEHSLWDEQSRLGEPVIKQEPEWLPSKEWSWWSCSHLFFMWNSLRCLQPEATVECGVWSGKNKDLLNGLIAACGREGMPFCNCPFGDEDKPLRRSSQARLSQSRSKGALHYGLPLRHFREQQWTWHGSLLIILKNWCFFLHKWNFHDTW